MKILAPAKLNLHLRVGPPRADGFHPLLSWMCTINLFDELSIELTSDPGIRLTCSDPSLPVDSKNLVYRAAELLLRDGEGVQIHLAKNIPDAGGLGGGSSDAASTLLAIAEIQNRNIDLAPLAAQIGSDVPFFLRAPSAVCQGRGEIVQSIAPASPKLALLILPKIKMPTPAVYKKLDDLTTFGPVIDNIDWGQWTRLDARSLLPRLKNDLETPAFAINPELGHLRSQLANQLDRPVRMSGSGSSLFTLYDNPAEALAGKQLISTNELFRAEVVELGGNKTNG